MEQFSGSPNEWNELLARLPMPHFLQTWEWAQVKQTIGWQPLPFIWRDGEKTTAAAMLLKRSLPIGGFAARLSVLYAPKGPNLDWDNLPLVQRVLDDLQRFAKKQGAIFLKIDPDVVLATGIPDSDDEIIHNGGQAAMSGLAQRGWIFSADQIQFRNTVWVDLSPSEDDLLSQMKQKTRYNVRLAGRKGVIVRAGTQADLSMLYQMYAETSLRDGFAIRSESYYHTVWSLFMQHEMAEPLIAEVDGQPVAAVFVFTFAGCSYYVYGMSRDAHREKMPNYVLQWEAMRLAKQRGSLVYDLWGAPEVFDQSDPLWGVFRFKDGLGGKVYRTLGAWDFVPNRLWYHLYTQLIPRVLNVMRSLGRAKTRQQVSRE